MFVSLVLTYLFVTGQATPVSLWVDNAPAPRPVKKEEPKTEPTKKEEPKKEEPKKEEPKKEEPKKEEPKKEEPKKEEPKKEEPKKEEPKKEEPKKEEPKKEQPKEEARPGPIGKNPTPKPSTLKKYDDVVTKEAKTTFGLFTVHRFDDKILFEIPQDKLGTLLLWRAETAKTSAGMGYNGAELGKRFIKFERRENKMLMIEPVFDKRAGKDNQAAVEATNTEGIILSMPVEAEGKDRSAVVNVTGLYLSDISDIGARRATGGMGGAIDADKSYLSEVKTFPTNIEVRSTLAIRGGGSGMPGLPGMPPAPNPAAARANIALVHFSLVALPDTPMQGRYFDPRVGYFTEQFYEHGGGKGWIHERQFITRYRLEKKDPSAAISEPVKPIVYYIAPEVPEKYRAYIKKGIEDWQPAFEKAGFKNAILCKDPPSKSEDPNWDPEDARWSVIRWVSEPVSNAMGPHVHDPRSGEIISAHVIFWHDIVKLTNLWYFVQCSALDERARKFPFSMELTGELIRYVAAHEVGHTLGLRHNHRASQAYSIEQLRDPKFLEANGNVASIMSYGRYNYVAQPEDKIPVKNLIPKIAPYDLFAIEWGYKPVPGQTADSERATLDTWAERQVKEPFLRHGGEDAPATVDPTVLTENIGSDPVKATELGLKNLDRVLDYLVEATTAKGDDFETLRDAYNSINTHRTNWFGAVLKQVGGVVENRTMGGRGEQFSRVPKEKQREAVKFLLDKGFTVPTKLIQPSIVNTLKFSNVGGEAMTLQKVMLTSLLSSERLNRLLDAEILDPDSAYTTADLVSDVQAGLWVELKDETPKIHPMRRSLQQKYVEILIGEFDKHDAGAPVFLMPGRGMPGGGSGRSSELRSVARISLKDLAKQIKAALPGVKDLATRAHLQDCLGEMESVLDAKKK